MDNKIYKEAILDAKALRAGAIANAKSIMQEALEPAIQEMMRLKLSEELEEDLEEGTYEEGYEEEGMHKEGETYDEGVDDEVTEATLEEILAELDELDGKEEGAINEAEGDDEAADDAAEGETKDNTELLKLTVGELKDVLSSVLSQVQGDSAETGDEADEMGDEAGEGSEEAPLSLDEILAEMEAKKYEEGKDHVEEDVMTGAKKAALDLFGNVSAENTFLLGLGVVGAVVAGAIALPKAIPMIKGYWAALTDKGEKAELAKAAEKVGVDIDGDSAPVAEEKHHGMEEELKMAKETIAELRESINEINLLNAKLLYMNKIFKAKSLTESEKVKVVKAFDRNASIKEVKNTYETLKESIQAKKSQVIKESVGFASKPIGVAPKTNIVEADAFVNRWQKIAGIK